MDKYNLFTMCNEINDSFYKYVKKYEYQEAMFFIEPNFYTQLVNLKIHFEDRFQDIISTILNVVIRNKKVIFTADYEHPVVYKEGYIYREIDDILGELKLSFDNKINPDTDWKD